MKILVLCDEGNNRSVTLAHQLKYLGHDVLTAGLKRNDSHTIRLLADWSDKIILTDAPQVRRLQLIATTTELGSTGFGRTVEVWDIGPDVYPRPFNPHLLKICRQLIEEHPEVHKK